MLLAIIVILAVAVSVLFVVLAVARPGARLLAFRNSRRRPVRALLVLCGVVVATAIVTSASGIGDSWRASVRQSAYTQLGPVDEEAVVSGSGEAPALARLVEQARITGIDGTLPIQALGATVRGRDFVARVAQGQVLEVDFAQAERFGGDAAATGISGPTPSAGEAVLGQDLADSLSIAPGHRVTIYAYGQERTFRVARILPRRGIAGLAAVTGPTRSTSLNLFVPPGTIASMLHATADPSRQTQPVFVLAVSNAGGVINDRRAAASVTAALRTAAHGVPAEIVPVKQQTLDDADARSRHFTDLFHAFGILSALGGLLLLTLTFLMLTRDRMRSMAILRAQGFRRGGVVEALALEGWCYALVGTALGALGGIGLTGLVIALASGVAAEATTGGTDLVVSVRASSVAFGLAIGLLVSMVVVVSAALVAARANVAGAMRGVAAAARPPHCRSLIVAGAASCGAGAMITIVGLAAGNLAASVAGPAVAAAGVVLLGASSGRGRALVSLLSVAVFGWSLVAVTVVGGDITGAAAIVAEGIVLSACAVAFAVVNRDAVLGRAPAGRGRRGLPIELGFAYARTGRRRTALLTAMYALVLFTLSLLVTVAHLYGNDVDNAAQRLGGGAALEVTSNGAHPVPPADVTHLAGVTHVVEAATLPVAVNGESAVAVGIDDTFSDHGSPPLAESSGPETFALVARDPTKVIVGADLEADATSGFAAERPRVGSVVTVRNPATGVARSLAIAGIAATTRYNGEPHVYVSRATVDDLNRGPAPANLLLVDTSAGTNNDVLAAVIDGTHLTNGTYARSFTRLASESLSAEEQFLNIAAAYAAVGLVAVLAGIGVLMTDRVRERRREIATVRALGLDGRTVRRAFRVETLAIALEGTLIGALSGTLLANRLGASGTLGRSLGFAVPVVPLLAIVVAVLVTSLLAASLAARRAGRLRPAVALRDD